MAMNDNKSRTPEEKLLHQKEVENRLYKRLEDNKPSTLTVTGSLEFQTQFQEIENRLRKRGFIVYGYDSSRFKKGTIINKEMRMYHHNWQLANIKKSEILYVANINWIVDTKTIKQTKYALESNKLVSYMADDPEMIDIVIDNNAAIKQILKRQSEDLEFGGEYEILLYHPDIDDYTVELIEAVELQNYEPVSKEKCPVQIANDLPHVQLKKTKHNNDHE